MSTPPNTGSYLDNPPPPRFSYTPVSDLSADQLQRAIAWGIFRGYWYILIISAVIAGGVAFIAWGVQDFIREQQRTAYSGSVPMDADYAARRADGAARSSPRPVGADYLHPQR